MKNKRGHKQTHLSLYAVLLIGIICIYLGTSSMPAHAQGSGTGTAAAGADIVLVPGTVSVDKDVENAILLALQNATPILPDIVYYAISDVRQVDGWIIASVIGLAKLDDALGWTFEDGAWFGLVLLKQEAGSWSGATQGTVEYSDLLAEIPDDILTESAKQALDPLNPPEITTQTGYIFPWQAGTSMRYGYLGVHPNGFPGNVTGWKAVDMLSDGDTLAGHAPNHLLAAAAGTISYRCIDSVNVAVHLGDFFYTHLLNNSNLYVGKVFNQGEEIGQLKPGKFQGNCGYADQNSDTFHVHWGFPNADLQVEAWTLSITTKNWTSGSTTISPGNGWIQAGGNWSSGDWTANYYDGSAHWLDRDNTTPFLCSETWNNAFLDKDYAADPPPCSGADGDDWVGDYQARINFTSGYYVFRVEHDDGLKLWVNNQDLAARNSSGGPEWLCPEVYLSGNTPLWVILREDTGDARVKVDWSTDTSVCPSPGAFSKNSPLNEVTGQPDSLTLSWNSSSGATGYAYCYDSLDNNICDRAWVSTGTDTSANISGLNSGSTYFWQVRAANNQGVIYADDGTWWHFTTIPCYKLTTYVNPSGSGSVSASPPPNCTGGKYTLGTSIQLTANAATIYEFANWGGDAYGLANPFSMTMDKDKTARAYFLIPGIPVLLSPANGALLTDYTPLLTWRDSTPNLDHYQLQVAMNSTFTTPVIDETDLHTYEYTPGSDLASNTIFYWRVGAFDTDGNSRGWSLASYFRTALLPPSLVWPEEAEAMFTGCPPFDWGDVSGAASYTIQIAKNNTFTLLARSGNVITSTYTPPLNLPASQTLYWRVRSNGRNGPSLWSEVRSFFSANPPGVPILLSPLSNALVTDYTPRLDWSTVTLPAGTTFDHYQVQVAADALFSSPEVNESALLDLNSSEFTPLADLTPNTRYYWRVRAFNTAGQYSNWSYVRIFRTALLPPNLIEPPEGEPVLTARPTFDWSDVSGASRYSIQIANNNTFMPAIVNLSITGSIYTPAVNLPPAQTLYWRVRSTGTNGPSLWSEVRSFFSANPPGVPILLSPLSNALVTDYTPRLDWSTVTLPAGTTFDHYQVQVAADALFSSLEVNESALLDLNTSEFTPLADLAPNIRHYWQVRAFNTAGQYSNWSYVRIFRSALPPPAPSLPANGDSTSDRTPTFDWSDVSGANSYTLQVSTNTTFTALWVNVKLIGSTYTPVINLPLGSIYWRVRSNGSNGPSAWINYWTLTITT